MEREVRRGNTHFPRHYFFSSSIFLVKKRRKKRREVRRGNSHFPRHYFFFLLFVSVKKKEKKRKNREVRRGNSHFPRHYPQKERRSPTFPDGICPTWSVIVSKFHILETSAWEFYERQYISGAGEKQGSELKKLNLMSLLLRFSSNSNICIFYKHSVSKRGASSLMWGWLLVMGGCLPLFPLIRWKRAPSLKKPLNLIVKPSVRDFVIGLCRYDKFSWRNAHSYNDDTFNQFEGTKLFLKSEI